MNLRTDRKTVMKTKVSARNFGPYRTERRANSSLRRIPAILILRTAGGPRPHTGEPSVPGRTTAPGRPLRPGTARGPRKMRTAGRILASAAILSLGILWAASAELPPSVLLQFVEERQTLGPNDGQFNDGFGYSLAMDGDTIAIGAGRDQDGSPSGRTVYVFARDLTNWARQAKIPGANGSFGTAVDISGDTIVVGENRADGPGNNAGRAHVFVRSGTTWSKQAELSASDAGADDRFGFSVAISGDTIVVGAYREDQRATDAGAAYVFFRIGTNWMQQQKLTASDGAINDWFAYSVDIDGDTIVTGNRGVRNGAYVFARRGTTWTQQQKLNPSPVDSAAQYGFEIGISGKTVVVGAPVDRPAPSAFVWVRNGTSWTQQQKITGNDTTFGDWFGNAVDIDGDGLVIGSYQDNSIQGSAYVFTRIGTTWTQQKRLNASNERNFTFFGISVAIKGNTVVAGSLNGDSPNGQGTGSAYVFESGDIDDAVLAGIVRRMLYYPEATVPPFAKTNAAFRYKHLLYGMESNSLRARFETMASFYGPAERARAADAEGIVATALASDSTNALLGNLLLDIYYDRTVAETIFAKELSAQGEATRFGPPLAPPAGSSGFIIDNEIPHARQVLATNRNALESYFALFTKVFGSTNEPPPGHRIFRDLVPTRGLEPATYESGDMHVSVVTNAMLFSGYKDLVLLFDLLRDYGRAAATLGSLLLARGDPGDGEEAMTSISGAQRFVFLQGNLLKGIFDDLPAAGDPSGLAEAIAGWSASLSQLENLQQTIAGEVNLLGFAPDFLMLIENFDEAGVQHFDSFDSFAERLSLSSLDSPLRIARDRLAEARAAHDLYRGYEDQVREQFDQSTVSYEFRLFEIVGARPGQPNYGDNPTNNSGSELDQQFRSIQLGRLRILRNQTEISNLLDQVQIEVNRAAAVSNTVIRYGDRQASLTRTIGHINATQAAANSLASALSVEKLTTGLFVGFLLNAVVQGGGEEWKGQLEAQKEELAAQERAEVEGIESAARVETLLLGMKTLALDSAEAALLLQQEVARLAALYREKSELEARIAERNADLSSRYFADPLHRLAAESSLVRANLAFNDAQKWLFFMVRALEYKWNLPFANFQHPAGGRLWSTATLFKLRNADELEDFYLALLAFDGTINRGKTFRFDWFSVREDFMHLKPLDASGQPATYIDAATGQTLDAVSMFRTNLLRRLFTAGNNQWIDLEFSTVRQIPGGFFFAGPTFDDAGNVITKGRFLDKIDYLQIRLPGDHSLSRPQLAGILTYAGTSLLRNFNVGHFDTERPDRLIDEMTPYSTRYWFYDPIEMHWRFNEGLTVENVEMELSPDPRIPPTVLRIEEFKERSVAATGWKLRIPTISLGVRVLRVDELDDVEIYFHHYSAQRQ